jgi:hypothetical protein
MHMNPFEEAKKKFTLIETDARVWEYLRAGEVADFYPGKEIDFAKAPPGGLRSTVSANLFSWLCACGDNSAEAAVLKPHGIRIRGARIEKKLDLASLHIPFAISLHECSIVAAIDLRHASVAGGLDLSGSQTVGIDADGLSVGGDLRLADKFVALGPVCLKGVTVAGNLACTRAKIDNQGCRRCPYPVVGCGDCRARILHAYALVLEGARVSGSVLLCDGFEANGGVHLGDSIIAGNMNCAQGKFYGRTHDRNLEGMTTGRRLACDKETEYHQACAFNGEGMQVEGNLILNRVESNGEFRLTGARIGGDLESAGGVFLNRGSNAIYGDRLYVRGNVFFCDKFHARGTVRLPRAEIGADLSFFDGEVSDSIPKLPGLFCEGLKVHGTVYLNKFEAADCAVDFSNATIDGNLDCSGSTFRNRDGWALNARGMHVAGSVFLQSRGEDNFLAEGIVSLTGSILGMDLICTNGQFKADRIYEHEKCTPCAIKADNMTIGGKVEMDGHNFRAEGGVNLDDTRIGSFLNCDHGTFIVPPAGGNYNCAISAGKLQVGGSIYLEEGFVAHGEVMLNDATIGRNLNCAKGTIKKTTDKNSTLRAMQMKVAGSVNLHENFVSHGEVRLDYAVIGGNLDCSSSQFLHVEENPSEQAGAEECGKLFALRAVGVKIEGGAWFMKNFSAAGIVSFQGATIGRDFIWKEISSRDKVSLFLDSARAGVLKDDEKSWPKEGRLQINDFEYQFLNELGPEALESRREKWLSLPLDFRTQPYEHLAAVLKRSGYEEDAKLVLIEKNRRQFSRPVFLGRFLILNKRKLPAKLEHLQTQSFATWIKQLLLYIFVCYGYRPSWAVRIGVVAVLLGWLGFWYGFSNKLMTPLQDGKSYIYQIAAVTGEAKDDADLPPGLPSHKVPMRINEGKDRVLYSLLYSFDTFLPVVDFQVADYWLPTAYYPEGGNVKFSWPGFWLCCYRWVLIVGGWLVTTFFLAALGGIVRR